MTTITVFRRSDDRIAGYECKGHTGYAESGEDVVCAAVSALTQSTLNGLLNVLAAPVDYTINEEDGYLTVSLGREFPLDKFDGAQLLLKTLVSGLQSVEAGYPRFVRVIFKERR